MRKQLLVVILSVLGFGIQAQLDDLMIVEYVDWDPGNGLAVKIYNPTTSAINLSGYTVSVYNNGNASPTNNVNLSGSLAAGGVLIIGNSGYPCSKDVSIGGGVNGDDCVALRKGTQFIDMINLHGTNVSPRIGSVSNGLFHKKIVRANDNCLRYTSTNGTSVNSWPASSVISVAGWVVSGPACLSTGGTPYNPAPLIVPQNTSICQGDSLLVGGVYHTSAGTYRDTVQSLLFCDSVIEVNLFITPFPQKTQNLQICNGDSVFLENAFRKTAGVYRDTVNVPNSCDSIIITNLQITQSFNISNTVSVCSGDSIMLEGMYRKTSGIYRDTLIAQNSCDSVISTQLNVLPSFSSSVSQTICEGDSIFLAGAWEKQAGVYVDTLVSTQGCDSVIHISLSVRPIRQGLRNIVICKGDSIFLEGQFRSVSGNYRDTLVSSQSCDSIVVTRLNINNILQSFRTIELCVGDSVFLQQAWQNTSGTYHDTLSGSGGCDSVVSTQLQVIPLPTVTYEVHLCKGDTIGVGGENWFSDTTIVLVKKGNGLCDSLVTYILTFGKAEADFDLEYDEQDPSTVYFESYSKGEALDHSWNFGDGGTSSIASPTHTYPGPGDYSATLVVIADGGCPDTLIRPVSIVFPEPVEEQMEVPNVFTPNGDGVNDSFKVDGSGWPLFSIGIYNRWGTQVYRSSDINFEWDGKQNGNECAEGTYMYIIEGNEVLKGFMTLVR